MVKKRTRKEFPAKRKFVLRRDASVNTGQRKIVIDAADLPGALLTTPVRMGG